MAALGCRIRLRAAAVPEEMERLWPAIWRQCLDSLGAHWGERVPLARLRALDAAIEPYGDAPRTPILRRFTDARARRASLSARFREREARARVGAFGDRAPKVRKTLPKPLPLPSAKNAWRTPTRARRRGREPGSGARPRP